MTDTADDKHRIGGLRWYHWLVVVLYTLSQALSGAHLGLGGIIASGAGAFIGAFITVWVLRAIWHALKSSPEQAPPEAAEAE